MCEKLCKQPFSDWDLEKAETLFCKNFSMPKSNLSFENLKSFIKDLNGILDDIVEVNEIEPGEENPFEFYLKFLENLKKVYIPCSKCNHMIAPDELYQIVEEEAVCQNCYGVDP
jgi:formylmethanofuran dehydrogenase subunit E